jgi:hypothetical protein
MSPIVYFRPRIQRGATFFSPSRNVIYPIQPEAPKRIFYNSNRAFYYFPPLTRRHMLLVKDRSEKIYFPPGLKLLRMIFRLGWRRFYFFIFYC